MKSFDKHDILFSYCQDELFFSYSPPRNQNHDLVRSQDQETDILLTQRFNSPIITITLRCVFYTYSLSSSLPSAYFKSAKSLPSVLIDFFHTRRVAKCKMDSRKIYYSIILICFCKCVMNIYIFHEFLSAQSFLFFIFFILTIIFTVG